MNVKDKMCADSFLLSSQTSSTIQRKLTARRKKRGERPRAREREKDEGKNIYTFAFLPSFFDSLQRWLQVLPTTFCTICRRRRWTTTIRETLASSVDSSLSNGNRRVASSFGHSSSGAANRPSVHRANPWTTPTCRIRAREQNRYAARDFPC